jgi:hypothetical protein
MIITSVFRTSLHATHPGVEDRTFAPGVAEVNRVRELAGEMGQQKATTACQTINPSRTRNDLKEGSAPRASKRHMALIPPCMWPLACGRAARPCRG